MIECGERRTKKKQECGDLDARGGKVAGTDQGRGHASEYLPPSSPTLHSSNFNSSPPCQFTVHFGYRLSGLGFDSGDLIGGCQVNIPPVGLILSIFLAICNSFEFKTEAYPTATALKMSSSQKLNCGDIKFTKILLY